MTTVHDWFKKGVVLGAIVLGMAGPVAAQTVVPFSITGFIQSFTVDNPGNLLSGGHITVNGIDVTIPANTVVVFPAAYWTMSQVLAFGPGVGYSGLALNDSIRNMGTYDASINGNMLTVNGTPTYVAGDVHISPHLAQNTDGYIRGINYVTGELCVGASPTPSVGCAPPDIRVRINDPGGVYGINGNLGRDLAGDDPRFQVDPDNPTIHAGSGYPMCIPRFNPATSSDPDCPIGNRPQDFTGAFLRTFVMSGPDYQASGGGGGGGGLITPFVQSCNNAPSFGATQTSPNQCQPDKQAPFVPGDYISFSGIPTNDGAVAATSINGNVGIYTEKGPGKTAYIQWDKQFIGTGPQSCAAVTVAECQFKVRVVGFATDPSRIGSSTNKLNFYYVDVNPFTGVKTTRTIVPIAVLNDPNKTPLTKDQGFFGRFRLDITKKRTDIQIPPTSGGPTGTGGLTRELLVSLDDNGPMPNGTIVPDTFNSPGRVKAHGLIAGQYWAPMPEYLFPEVALPGLTPPSMNFNCLNHLIYGWNLNFGAGPTPIPPLSPWPGSFLNQALGINCSTNP